jgi:hypothetical protein
MNRLVIFLTIYLFPFLSLGLNYQEYLWLHNSNQCSNYFDYFENKYNIPKHLLRSISTIETGRWHNKAELYFPWPWAVNQSGKSYYFNNKQEAISSVRDMLETGQTNIDIGCMQINLHHHPSAFLNLNQAFEPKDNIEYAANFLVNHYKKSQNWKKAVAAYHSLSLNGDDYAMKVFKIWSNYRNKELPYQHCTSNKGEITACNKKSENKNLFQVPKKEDSTVKPTKIEVSSEKSRKNRKRLKTSLITYSNSELN